MMEYRTFNWTIITHDIDWISENIILDVMRYHQQIDGLPNSFPFGDDISGQFIEVYQDLSDEAKAKFKEAVYKALQNWKGKSHQDAFYLINLIYLGNGMKDGHLVEYVIPLLDKSDLSKLSKSSPQDYKDVVTQIFRTVSKHSHMDVAFKFLKYHLMQSDKPNQYAQFLSWCLIGLCEADPKNYPNYLNQFVNIAIKEYYPHFNAELHLLNRYVPVQIFVNQLHKVYERTLEALYDRDKESFKACFVSYFNMIEQTDLNKKNVGRFSEWLCRDATEEQIKSYETKLKDMMFTANHDIDPRRILGEALNASIRSINTQTTEGDSRKRRFTRNIIVDNRKNRFIVVEDEKKKIVRVTLTVVNNAVENKDEVNRVKHTWRPKIVRG